MLMLFFPENRLMTRGAKPTGVILCLFILLTRKNVNPVLIQVPSDAIAMVNESTYFNCSTSIRPFSNKSIIWYHFPLDGGGQRNYVYADGNIISTYRSRFAVELDLSSGEINLLALRLEPKDAGRYECVDDVLEGRRASAELIVLESNLMCESNMDPGGIVGPTQCKRAIAPDEVQLLCSVAYSGRYAPQMVWRKSGDTSTSIKTDCVAKDNRVTCNTTMMANLQMNRAVYMCETNTRQYSCSLEVKNISYVFRSDTSIDMAMNEEVTCAANSSQSCSYEWIWFNVSDSVSVSTDPTLKSTRLGSHRCEATCDIGNRSCVLDAMSVKVSPVVAATSGQYLWLLLSLLLICLPIIGIIICWRRKRLSVKRTFSDTDEAKDQPALPMLMPQLTDEQEESNQHQSELTTAFETAASNECEDIEQLISESQLLAREGLGKVYAPCSWKNKVYAIRKRQCREVDNFKEERENWLSLQHKNLIKVFDIIFNPPDLYILMEFAGGRSLFIVFKNLKVTLEEDVLMDWSLQIAEGMAYLHQKDFVHRYFMSARVVVLERDAAFDPRGTTLKIIGFDQIRETDHTAVMTAARSHAWMAPEVLDGEYFSKAGDVWSYGVILWEMSTKEVPFDGVDGDEITLGVTNKTLTLEVPDSCPDVIRTILESCQRFERDKRPTFEQILSTLQDHSESIREEISKEGESVSNDTVTV